MEQNVTVVILAAGLGTRMKSAKAKVLHEAAGDTLLNHIIRAALQVAPAEQIVAVVGHQAQKVQESVKASGIRFAEQNEQKGTGHAVRCARETVPTREGELLILNGDGPLLRPETLGLLVKAQQEKKLGGTIVTTEAADPTGYGRIIRDSGGLVAAIIEEKSASAEQKTIREINPGLYCFNAALFWKYLDEVTPNNAAGEYYLTDMVEVLTRHNHGVAPLMIEDETELLGINTRVELAFADKVLRSRKAHSLMLAGVTMENPDSIAVDFDVEVGQDSVIESGVQLRGETHIGANCRIGAGSILRDCDVEDHVTILPYVVAENSRIGARASVGPFSRLRLDAHAEAETHIGNFVELKKTKLGVGSKASHLAYLGDSEIGSRVNIGAGTITCNYDGDKKHKTEIADGVFVGSNSTLVAPLTLGEGSFIAAGSVITKDVDSDALAIARSMQVDKPDWAKRRRRESKIDS